MSMSKEDLARWMSSGGSSELAEAARLLAAVVEKFRRGMTVAILYGGQRDETFEEGIEAINDDDFLRDLEHFGGALASAARVQRTKAEARRVGESYSAGA